MIFVFIANAHDPVPSGVCSQCMPGGREIFCERILSNMRREWGYAMPRFGGRTLRLAQIRPLSTATDRYVISRINPISVMSRSSASAFATRASSPQGGLASVGASRIYWSKA